MTSIAQRRVAGATAIMIMLYLLQVALFATPATAADTTYRFVFQNGVEITGSVTGGQADIDDSVFENFYAPDPVPFDLPESIHVSCSESFPGGWTADGAFPDSSDHPDWQISWYKIDKFAGQARACGETFEKGSITVVKTTSPETDENFTFALSGSLPPAPGTSGTVPTPYGPEGRTVAGDGGTASWEDLDAGSYSLTENTGANPAGYTFSTVQCVDDETALVVVASPGNNPALFDLEGGQNITCTFHNVDDTPPSTTTTTTTLPPSTTTTSTTLPPSTTTTSTTLPPSTTTTSTTLPPSTTTTSTTLPPPPPSQVLVQVDAICVPDPVNGPGTGEFDIDIDPANGATVTINGLGSFTQSTTITDLDDASAWIVTVSANGGWTLAAGSDTSGTYEIEDCSVEVRGTTVTTAPEEVSADTLPFTGFEAGDTVRLGLLAMAAGLLTLFAAHRTKEEEETAPVMGSSWSDL